MRQTFGWVTLRASWISRLKRSIGRVVGGDLGPDGLERHPLAQLEVLRLVDLAHAAARDEAHDAVAVGEHVAVGQGGRQGRAAAQGCRVVPCGVACAGGSARGSGRALIAPAAACSAGRSSDRRRCRRRCASPVRDRDRGLALDAAELRARSMRARRSGRAAGAVGLPSSRSGMIVDPNPPWGRCARAGTWVQAPVGVCARRAPDSGPMSTTAGHLPRKTRLRVPCGSPRCRARPARPGRPALLALIHAPQGPRHCRSALARRPRLPRRHPPGGDRIRPARGARRRAGRGQLPERARALPSRGDPPDLALREHLSAVLGVLAEQDDISTLEIVSDRGEILAVSRAARALPARRRPSRDARSRAAAP